MNSNHLVSTYGYWAVLLFVMLESLGIPLPGETILIAAAIYAGQTHHLSVWGVWGLASVAAVVGDNIGYWIGDKGGYRLLRKYGHYIRVKERELKVGRYIFDRYGPPVVFFGRFVSILRTYAAFLAGTNRMHWRKFFLYNMLGGVVWAGIWTFLAYYLGNSLKHASGKVNLIVGIVAVFSVLAVIILVRRKSKQLEAVAEAAYPGPLPD